MATSPNFGWLEPDNTDLVKNGALAIRTAVNAIDASMAELKGGTTGQVLSKTSNTDMDFTWTTPSGGSNQFYAGKNKIINGKLDVWQRGTSFSNPANEAYLADRFNIVFDGSGSTRTVSQQTFTPGTAPVSGYEGSYFIRMAQTVAGSGGTYLGFNQRIEDVRTFAGQTVTLSFWAKADATRTVLPNLQQNFGSGGSTTVNITSGFTSTNLTTSWARYTFTVSIPSISGKTIGTSSFLQLYFGFAANTVQTVDIWGVQLEAGSSATDFQTATGTIQGELSACQRYYVRYTNGVTNGPVVPVTSYAVNTTLVDTMVSLPVQMRVQPSVLDYSNIQISVVSSGTGYTTGSWATAVSTYDPKMAQIRYTHGSGVFTAGQIATLNSQTTSGYVGLSAEL
jgi:hypothetical protein